jgi:nucleoid DNA-binding protein
MKKINRDQLSKIVGDKLGGSHKDGKIILKTVLDTLVECLEDGNQVQIRNFGRFEVRSYGERNGRNPKTGETFVIQPKTKVLFKAGVGLRSGVQQ